MPPQPGGSDERPRPRLRRGRRRYVRRALPRALPLRRRLLRGRCRSGGCQDLPLPDLPGIARCTHEWAAIFHKRHVRMTRGIEHLRFYAGVLDRPGRVPPCKVSCALCGTPVADEGRRMWLAFPTLFEFGAKDEIPEAFRPTCHIFYAQRVVDVDDGLPKWSGH